MVFGQLYILFSTIFVDTKGIKSFDPGASLSFPSLAATLFGSSSVSLFVCWLPGWLAEN